MKLNCKQGDLAFLLVDGQYMKAGAIVKCIRFYGLVENPDLGWFNDVWHVEYRGTEISPRGIGWGVPDRYLRPLRDQDGEDEMLRIAGLPHEVAA